MSTRTRADIERFITATVSRRLHLPAADLAPATDLRTLRAFSSFVGVDILENLEGALQVEVPANRLLAEQLCSVTALTDLFLHALAEQEAMAQ